MTDRQFNDPTSMIDENRKLPIGRRSVLKGVGVLGAGNLAGPVMGRASADDPASIDTSDATDPADYVNPFLGTAQADPATGGFDPRANTWPGPTRPHGMVQLSPDTPSEPNGGYAYEDDYILGFTHTHLSGTGRTDFGNVLMTAMTNGPATSTGGSDSTGYGSEFSHDAENAEVGYYSVDLTDYNVTAELTTTRRVGVHRYTFPQSDTATIVIDPTRSLGADVTDASVEIVDNDEIRGSLTIAYPFGTPESSSYDVHFVARFEKSCETSGTWNRDNISEGSTSEQGSEIGAYAQYSTNAGESVVAKVGLSFVSQEGAKRNLQEVSDFDFDSVRSDAQNEWNDALKRIQVSGGSEANKVKFYTGLYHAQLGPYTFSDIDGKYLGVENDVRTTGDYTNYHTFSNWDIFRAVTPLHTIIDPNVQNDIIKSLVDMHESGGWLPRWGIVNRYTSSTFGDHASSIISESYLKGLRDYDVEEAYGAMKKNATQIPKSDSATDFLGRRVLDRYTTYGYVPDDLGDTYAGTVSSTLEYAYTDWAISRVADDLGKDSDAQQFADRGQYWRNAIDADTGFARRRNSDGSWANPWNPQSWDGFFEGNSWTYTWSVQHNITGLVDHVGADTFTSHLEEHTSELTYPGAEEEFKHYWHGNEPDHHVPYLFNYIGQPWKTQEHVQDIMNGLYTDGPGGITGNDDMGQMSAWFVFSAMGFYPVAPAKGTYAIGMPIFDEIIIDLPECYDGDEFVIRVEGSNYATDDYRYIESARLDTPGEPDKKSLRKPWITHEEVTQGSTLKLTVGENPNKSWGTDTTSS